MFQGLYNKVRSRYDMVVHFMAVLELSKQHKLKIYQQDMMGPLWFYRADLDESILPVSGPVPMHDAATDAPVVDVPSNVMIADLPEGPLLPNVNADIPALEIVEESLSGVETSNENSEVDP